MSAYNQRDGEDKEGQNRKVYIGGSSTLSERCRSKLDIINDRSKERSSIKVLRASVKQWKKVQEQQPPK